MYVLSNIQGVTQKNIIDLYKKKNFYKEQSQPGFPQLQIQDLSSSNALKS